MAPQASVSGPDAIAQGDEAGGKRLSAAATAGSAKESDKPANSEQSRRPLHSDGERVAKAFGQAVGLLMASPRHRHYSLTDLEWMLVPPLILNQFTILAGRPKGAPEGATVPLGMALWARVSEDIDKRLSEAVDRPIRLKPEEWASGEVWWLIDVIGPSQASNLLILQLRRTALKDVDIKMRVKNKDGKIQVKSIPSPDEGKDFSAEA